MQHQWQPEHRTPDFFQVTLEEAFCRCCLPWPCIWCTSFYSLLFGINEYFSYCTCIPREYSSWGGQKRAEDPTIDVVRHHARDTKYSYPLSHHSRSCSWLLTFQHLVLYYKTGSPPIKESCLWRLVGTGTWGRHANCLRVHLCRAVKSPVISVGSGSCSSITYCQGWNRSVTSHLGWQCRLHTSDKMQNWDDPPWAWMWGKESLITRKISSWAVLGGSCRAGMVHGACSRAHMLLVESVPV